MIAQKKKITLALVSPASVSLTFPEDFLFSEWFNLPLKNGRLPKMLSLELFRCKLLNFQRVSLFVARNIVRKVTVGMIYPYNLVGITIQ